MTKTKADAAVEGIKFDAHILTTPAAGRSTLPKMALELTVKSLPETHKGIAPKLTEIASYGVQAVERLEKVAADKDLSPQGKKTAATKVLADVLPKLKSYRQEASEMSKRSREVAKEALVLPEAQPGGLSDDFLATQLAKMQPGIVAQRFLEGCSDPAKKKNAQVVRAVFRAAEAGIELVPQHVLRMGEDQMLENSPAKERAELIETTANYYGTMTGTAVSAVRKAAKDLGLEDEVVIALQDDKQ